MSRGEIAERFSQIVDFSGVANFLDTPVKHYSSGIARAPSFSVAAWLDQDILIVDEVLAVGDQTPFRKCADRMKETNQGGANCIVR